MATLTKTERQQLRRISPALPLPPRWESRPVKEYVAFATFASRLKAGGKVGLIEGGKHWKL